MALHDKFVCMVCSGLVLNSNISSWHYKKGQKDIQKFYVHKRCEDVHIHEFKGFIIKYNKSLYHIIGLDNFSIKYTFEGYPVYYTNKTDGYPIKIINNSGHIVKKILIIVNSDYFPLGSKCRKFMIKDLESFDKDLSKNIHLKRLEPTYYLKDEHNINVFSIINLLKSSEDIYLLFHALVKHPYSYLSKRYFKCRHPKRLDNKTIKLDVVNQGSKYYSFFKIIKYNTEENRLMKYILERVMYFISVSIKYVDNSKYFKSQPKSLFIKALKNLYNYLDYINNYSFFKDISDHVTKFPSNLIYLYRYSLIYKKYKELFNNRIFIESDIHYLIYYKYSYSIKPTSNLYELWTYIYTLKYLMHFGFQIYKIKHSNIKESLVDFLNYGLKRGTTFYLRNKDGIYLNVIYNKSIDYDSQSPIYSFNDKIRNLYKLKNLKKEDERKDRLHDKPDIRIDIFNHSNLYISSIILDAKCSDENTINKERRDVYQLLAYRYYINYKHSIIQKYPVYFQLLNFSPIRGTFVLFAGKKSNSKSHNIIGINYINLRPHQTQSIYSNKLIKIINSCSRVINILKKHPN